MKKTASLLQSNLDLSRKTWGELPESAVASLRELTQRYRLNVAVGDLRYIDRRWYVTHSGLLRIAHRRRCQGVRTTLQRASSDPAAGRWVFKATVYKTADSRGFVGYGDADPSNTSPLVRGAEMRVAETRAVNRALRKAYGIGLCSVEELGWLSGPPEPSIVSLRRNGSHPANGSHTSQPRLRDQLCLVIRQYNLDPTLVKAYAADFCGTQSLKDARRDRVEAFISQLAASAKEDRDALVCKLSSYAHPPEVKL